MTDLQNPNTQRPPPSPSSSSKIPIDAKSGISNANSNYKTHKIPYPNPPDPINPDPATLRDQWRYAIRQYSKWYSHAWGTAILAGLSFFALGWVIKGSNPLDAFKNDGSSSSPSKDADETRR